MNQRRRTGEFRGQGAALISCGLLFMAVAPFQAAGQARYNPGDRVQCDWLQNGSYEAGTVTPFLSTDLDQSGRWYRVKLDKDTIPNSTVECMTARLRPGAPAPAAPAAAPAMKAAPAAAPARTAAPQTKAPTAQPKASAPQPKAATPQPKAATPARPAGPPAGAGGMPGLPGTAWKIDFGSGVTGTVFLFCSTGTWQIVPASGAIGAVGSSYRVSGNRLTTVNRDDGKSQNWQMSNNGGVLTLNDGRETMRLHYNGQTQCR